MTHKFKALTEEIARAIHPLLGGHERGDVVKAMAAAFWGAILATKQTPLECATLIRAYCDALDPAMTAAVQQHHDTKYGHRDGGSTVYPPPDIALYTAFGIAFRSAP